MNIEDTCDRIRYHHRKRNFAMEQRKRADLALGAFLRMNMGWRLDLPAEERRAIADRASAVLKVGVAVFSKLSREDGRQKLPDESNPDFSEWSEIILASFAARAGFAKIEEDAAKDMESLVKTLPIYEWAKGVRGLGARSVAVIIGEAGNLSQYPKKGHLWKRMGLAVIDGVRQGGLTKSASKDAWIQHGYNAARRSRMFVVGDCLVKSGDHYRQVYLARKEYERQMAEGLGLIVAPAAKIPAKRKDEYISDGHIHRRAQRYMEKKLLRDMRSEWIRCQASWRLPYGAERVVPASELSCCEAGRAEPEQGFLSTAEQQPDSTRGQTTVASKANPKANGQPNSAARSSRRN